MYLKNSSWVTSLRNNCVYKLLYRDILLFSGILKCILNVLLKSEVQDVTIIPISINYDRLLEDKLFSYELLGIPKPKETTLVSTLVISKLI